MCVVTKRGSLSGKTSKTGPHLLFLIIPVAVACIFSGLPCEVAIRAKAFNWISLTNYDKVLSSNLIGKAIFNKLHDFA